MLETKLKIPSKIKKQFNKISKLSKSIPKNQVSNLNFEVTEPKPRLYEVNVTWQENNHGRSQGKGFSFVYDQKKNGFFDTFLRGGISFEYSSQELLDKYKKRMLEQNILGPQSSKISDSLEEYFNRPDWQRWGGPYIPNDFTD